MASSQQFARRARQGNVISREIKSITDKRRLSASAATLLWVVRCGTLGS